MRSVPDPQTQLPPTSQAPVLIRRRGWVYAILFLLALALFAADQFDKHGGLRRSGESSPTRNEGLR